MNSVPAPTSKAIPRATMITSSFAMAVRTKQKKIDHDLRRRIAMDLLPALRDAEGDLASWRRSPLRPLIEQAFGGVARDELQKAADSVEAAAQKITEFDAVKSLEESIGALFKEMSGPRQDVQPRLGFG